MLTEQEIQEIRHHAAMYPRARAAASEALKLVQRRTRWIRDEDLSQIASLLDMSTDELDGVATFYNLVFRKPVGRHVILLCDSVSCWITGQSDVRTMLQKKLGVDFGQTTADDRFTLLPTVCLGACDRAPAMMIDEDLHGPLDEAEVDRALAQYS